MTLPIRPTEDRVAPFALGAEALEQLRRGLHIIALRSLRDADAAEEAVQETIARALAALHDGRVRDGAPLGAFVRGIARHVIADALRARMRSLPFDELPEEHPQLTVDTLQQLVSEEEHARVRAAFATLAQSDRKLLEISILEGLSIAALSGRLHEPAARLRKRKSRALERLRTAFLGASASHQGDLTESTVDSPARTGSEPKRRR